MKKNSKKTRNTTIITDPIHQIMNLGSDQNLKNAIKNIIDTKTFQRLRRISQLGLASFVFPGATHTRFSHSLGVTYLAYKVLMHLKEKYENDNNINIDKYFTDIVISALLHDVGHGPFSHSFEKVISELYPQGYPPYHEDWTRGIIENNNTDINNSLKQNNIEPEKISSIFNDELSSKIYPNYLKEIVASQLDVDRMDYLLRDSHFAGVEIGRVDIHYLINSLIIINHGNSNVNTLGITEKGIKAYEGFAISRQLMNRTVYYHRKVKVFEYMMEQFIRYILRDIKKYNKVSSIKSLIPEYFYLLTTSDLKFDNKSNKYEFIDESINTYIKMTENTIWSLLEKIADGYSDRFYKESQLANMILKRQPLESYLIPTGKDLIVEQTLSDINLKKNVDYGIVKLKTTLYKTTKDERVFVYSDDGYHNDIPSRSELLSLFKDRAEGEDILIVLNSKYKQNIKKVMREIRK